MTASPSARHLSTLRSAVGCPVCMAGVGDRLLSCGHSFCAACLVRIVRIVRIDGDGTPVTDRGGDARQNATITCPTCRQQTRVPGALALSHAEAAQAGGDGASAMLMHAVSRLPVNVTARAVADSLAAVDWCSGHGINGGGNINGDGNGSGSASSASAPSDDPDVVEAWCRHCQRGVCAKCATQHQHSAAVTPQLIPLVEAPQMYRRAIDEQLRALRMREATSAGEWQAMERHRQRLLAETDAAMAAAFKQLMQRYRAMRVRVQQTVDAYERRLAWEVQRGTTTSEAATTSPQSTLAALSADMATAREGVEELVRSWDATDAATRLQAPASIARLSEMASALATIQPWTAEGPLRPGPSLAATLAECRIVAHPLANIVLGELVDGETYETPVKRKARVDAVTTMALAQSVGGLALGEVHEEDVHSLAAIQDKVKRLRIVEQPNGRAVMEQ